jgi:N-methylhydantoinase A
MIEIGAGGGSIAAVNSLGLMKVGPPTVDDVRGYPAALTAVDWGRVAALYDDMESQARRLLLPNIAAPHGRRVERSADMRYVGQGFEINVPLPGGALDSSCEDRFREAFRRLLSVGVRSNNS